MKADLKKKKKGITSSVNLRTQKQTSSLRPKYWVSVKCVILIISRVKLSGFHKDSLELSLKPKPL